jgi:RND family efflux transporter MFP subunit
MVEIRARVTGYVMVAPGDDGLPIKEGQLVHEGQLLFQIDPRSYLADFNQAKANLKLAEADRNLQEKNTERARDLVNRKAMSQEDFETVVATYEKSKATVKSMEAARDKAKLYLDYTRVTSPVAGRISRRYVDPGNLVNADNTVLTTVVTENPMFAFFDVDERTYLDLVASAHPAAGAGAVGLGSSALGTGPLSATAVLVAGGAVPSPSGQMAWFSRELKFPVLMRLTTEDEFVHAGYVNFIDNQVSPTTGTIRLRGVFANLSGNLKPGLFVRIRLPLGNPYPALLIPDEALQSDQGRKLVYVVKDQMDPETHKYAPVAEYRSVELGQAIKGLRVIKKGLAKGERVIINGMQRVRDGLNVRPQVQAPPQPPASALVKLLTGNRPPQIPRQGDRATKLQPQ